MLEQTIRLLATEDITVSGIFAAETSWPYKSEFIMKNRPSNQLYCNLSGRRDYYMNGECILHIREDDVVLMPTGSSYTTVAVEEEGNRGIGVLFSLRSAQGAEIILDTAPRIVAADGGNYFKNAMQELKSYMLQGGFAILKAKELLYMLLHRITFAQTLIQNNPVLMSILPAVRYMESNLQQTLSVDLLASMCFISRSTFFRRFRAEFGAAPADYHLKMRIQKSRELLESNLYTVEQVAEIMGFCDTAYFSRIFKQFTGLRAGDLRASGKGRRYLQSL